MAEAWSSKKSLWFGWIRTVVKAWIMNQGEDFYHRDITELVLYQQKYVTFRGNFAGVTWSCRQTSGTSSTYHTQEKMCLETYNLLVIAERIRVLKVLKMFSMKFNTCLYTSHHGPPHHFRDTGVVADSLTSVQNPMVKCLFLINRSCICKGF
jgi:hypothetical protein